MPHPLEVLDDRYRSPEIKEKEPGFLEKVGAWFGRHWFLTSLGVVALATAGGAVGARMATGESILPVSWKDGYLDTAINSVGDKITAASTRVRGWVDWIQKWWAGEPGAAAAAKK